MRRHCGLALGALLFVLTGGAALGAGAYSAVVRLNGRTTGVGLVEVYNIQ